MWISIRKVWDSKMTRSIAKHSEFSKMSKDIGLLTAAVGAGISLRLLAVQIIDLVVFGGSGSDGFEEEEGYTFKEPEFSDEEDSDSSSESSEDSEEYEDF